MGVTLKRQPMTIKFTATASTACVPDTSSSIDGGPVDVSQMAFGGLHVASGLNGKVIRFFDTGAWGTEVVLSKTVATGFNAFTQDELLALAPTMQLSADITVSGTGSFWLKMKS